MSWAELETPAWSTHHLPRWTSPYSMKLENRPSTGRAGRAGASKPATCWRLAGGAVSVKGRDRAEKDEGSAMDPDPGSQPGKRTLTMNPMAQDGKDVLASAKPSAPPLSGSDVDIESQQPAYPTIDHDTRIAARPGTMGLWFEPKEGYVEFMERQARLGFTRKVLGIVSVQLLLTSVIGHYVAFEPVTRDYINGNPWITIFAMCLGFSNLLVLAIFDGKYMRQYPTNYLLLLSFTLTQGFMVSLHPLSVHVRGMQFSSNPSSSHPPIRWVASFKATTRTWC